MKSSKTKSWIEAMRLRTLPVSVAGVLAGGGCAAWLHSFKPLPFLICLAFAVLAQIVSNFANEYFDWRNGLDRKGREGFRRGVTEGDISPKAMLWATLGLMAFTCLLGCSLICWGGWWLLPVGVAIAIFAFAYSAGPWPLSHHGLGEIAVVIFFGLVPVTLTAWIQTQDWNVLYTALPISIAVGLLGANVMIVNNYRDYYDDRQAGKRTLAVIIGRKATRTLYIVNAFLALLLVELGTIAYLPYMWQLGPLLFINCAVILWKKIGECNGRELNPLLGKTAMLLLGMAVWILVALACNPVKVS